MSSQTPNAAEKAQPDDAVALTCYYSTNRGRYNFCSTGQQWCASLSVTDGGETKRISETWPEDEEYCPINEGAAPTEVLEAISERLESYWMSTGREEGRKTIEWMRARSDRMDDAWASSRIASLQKQINSLSHYLLDTEAALASVEAL